MGKKEVELLDSNNLKYSNFSCGTNHKIWKKIGWKPKYSSIEGFKKNIKKILIYKNNKFFFFKIKGYLIFILFKFNSTKYFENFISISIYTYFIFCFVNQWEDSFSFC